MSKALRILPVVVVAILSLAACEKKPAPSQTAVPSVPAPVPVPVAPAPAVPPPAPPGLEGDWRGSAGKDHLLSFNVQGNQVPSLNASYSGQNGPCSYSGSFGSDGPAAVNSRAFTAHGKNKDIEFNLKGSFTSDSEASGTISWKGKSDLCGEFSMEEKWTAKKNPPEVPEVPDED